MPRLIDSIDQIARRKRREVLFLKFSKRENDSDVRRSAIQWLNENGVPFSECFDVWDEGLIEAPYQGSLYLDLPYDKSDSLYLKIQDHFENKDESPRIVGVTLMLLRMPR